MLLNAYSFLDTKVGAFSPPFFMAHQGMAVRAAMELGSDMSTQIGRYPEDFHLYQVGTFEVSTGALSACAPLSLGPVSSLLPTPRPGGQQFRPSHANGQDSAASGV